MAQSLSQVYIHYIFSTKNHYPFISEVLRPELQSYIIGTLTGIESYTLELFANPEHIHILGTIPRTITMAQLISKIKTSSSVWMKKNGVPQFDWQNGYAAFSVSSSKTETVRRYILNQSNHHLKVSFKDELRRFFKEYQIKFDERYVWD